jgi:hypothetical protein
VTLGARIAYISAIADGLTRCAFGAPGSESIDVVELQPKRVVAPPEVVERARGTARPSPPAAQSTPGKRVLQWLRGGTELKERKH